MKQTTSSILDLKAQELVGLYGAPAPTGSVSLSLVILITLGILALVWWPVEDIGDWQGPEMPPCAHDYLVVC